MRLELELGRGAEGAGVHLHEALAVAAGVQAVHSVLDDVQALVARRLQVVLGRQVGPEGAVQAGVEAQVTALSVCACVWGGGGEPYYGMLNRMDNKIILY